MFDSWVSWFTIDELSLGNAPPLGTLLQHRRAEFRSCFVAWYLVPGSPSWVYVMPHSLVPCFRIAELSLGNLSQLGILLQDRRAGFW